MKRIHTLVPAWALLTLLAGPAGLRAGEVKAKKLTPPQQVEALTRVIRHAAGPREALAAHTRATAIDARNVLIRDVTLLPVSKGPAEWPEIG